MKPLSAIDTNAQQNMPVEKSYSLKEAADLLGISVSGLRNWIRDGKIGAFKVGEKLIRINESEINRLSGKAHAQDPAPPLYVSREELKQALLEILNEPEFAERFSSIRVHLLRKQGKGNKK
jgi:excisionase family DNA binding protein